MENNIGGQPKELDVPIILDVVDYYHSGQNGVYYVVKYRDELFRKYSSHWTRIIDGKCAGVSSVDNNYKFHLDKVWDKHFKGKYIRKEFRIIIESI